MNASKHQPFRGPLSAELVAAGITVCRKNALRLYEDAILLFAAKRYPSAACLAILAIEELGKVPLLWQLAIVKEQRAVSKLWKAFTQHQEKNKHWVYSVILPLDPNFDELGDLENGDHAALLDWIKQLGFYTECWDKGNWKEPKQLFTRKFCSQIVGYVEPLLSERKATVREVELWIKHLGPLAAGADELSLKRAILAWHKEMEAESIPFEGTVVELEDFLNIQKQLDFFG